MRPREAGQGGEACRCHRRLGEGTKLQKDENAVKEPDTEARSPWARTDDRPAAGGDDAETEQWRIKAGAVFMSRMSSVPILFSCKKAFSEARMTARPPPPIWSLGPEVPLPVTAGPPRHPPVLRVPSQGDQWWAPSFLGCSVLLSWLCALGALVPPAAGAGPPSASSVSPPPGWRALQPFRMLWGRRRWSQRPRGTPRTPGEGGQPAAVQGEQGLGQAPGPGK